MMFKNILETIGRTPLVRINRLNPNPGVEIYAKLERFNPAGSVKERIAHYMIKTAEERGMLTPDKIIIEPTSGNTGIGLAMVAAVKGYKIELVMPRNMSVERLKMLKAYGARVIQTSAEKGIDGAIILANQLAKNTKKYFMPSQFENHANVLAHYETTGREIIEDVPKLNMFVAGLGTTGTLMGVSKRLKEHNPTIKIVAVEPFPGHRLQGLKNLDTQLVPGIYDLSRIDEKISVSDENAFEITRELAKKEGIFAGMSSGAAIWAAIQKAKQLENGTIVVLLPDGGEKYLSTPLFDL